MSLPAAVFDRAVNHFFRSCNNGTPSKGVVINEYLVKPAVRYASPGFFVLHPQLFAFVSISVVKVWNIDEKFGMWFLNRQLGRIFLRWAIKLGWLLLPYLKKSRPGAISCWRSISCGEVFALGLPFPNDEPIYIFLSSSRCKQARGKEGGSYLALSAA